MSDECRSMLPRLASWLAAAFPSRPMCAGIHWTLTLFDAPLADTAAQIEQNVGFVWRVGSWDKHWMRDLESVRTLVLWQALESCRVNDAWSPTKQATEYS